MKEYSGHDPTVPVETPGVVSATATSSTEASLAAVLRCDGQGYSRPALPLLSSTASPRFFLSRWPSCFVFTAELKVDPTGMRPASVQASRAARRTTLCPGVPHACVPAQRARSTFTKLPSDAFAGIMQQHKQVRALCRSPQFRKRNYDPKLQVARVKEWCVLKTFKLLDKCQSGIGYLCFGQCSRITYIEGSVLVTGWAVPQPKAAIHGWCWARLLNATTALAGRCNSKDMRRETRNFMNRGFT